LKLGDAIQGLAESILAACYHRVPVFIGLVFASASLQTAGPDT